MLGLIVDMAMQCDSIRDAARFGMCNEVRHPVAGSDNVQMDFGETIGKLGHRVDSELHMFMRNKSTESNKMESAVEIGFTFEYSGGSFVSAVNDRNAFRVDTNLSQFASRGLRDSDVMLLPVDER